MIVAVACGVTASFGSPLGGVLFSIEVTAKYYEIKYVTHF
jgi:H+/Cl- antiporter ClcA